MPIKRDFVKRKQIQIISLRNDFPTPNFPGYIPNLVFEFLLAHLKLPDGERVCRLGIELPHVQKHSHHDERDECGMCFICRAVFVLWHVRFLFYTFSITLNFALLALLLLSTSASDGTKGFFVRI